MDKTAILKARVSEKLHENFLAVCDASGRPPASVIRDLAQRYVIANHHLLEDNVQVSIERPDDYQYGAWRAQITLRTPEAMRFQGAPIPFALPRLLARRIHPDEGYAVATSNWDGQGSGLSGIFVKGVWEGHVYSNGIEEDKNPTSIDAVRDALKAVVADRLEAAS